MARPAFFDQIANQAQANQSPEDPQPAPQFQPQDEAFGDNADEEPEQDEATDENARDLDDAVDDDAFESLDDFDPDSLDPAARQILEVAKRDRDEMRQELREMRGAFHGAGAANNMLAHKATQMQALESQPAAAAVANLGDVDFMSELPKDVREAFEEQGPEFMQAVQKAALQGMVKDERFREIIGTVQQLKAADAATRQDRITKEAIELEKLVGRQALTPEVVADMQAMMNLPAFANKPLTRIYELATQSKIKKPSKKKAKVPPQSRRGQERTERTVEPTKRKKTRDINEAIRRANARIRSGQV